MEKILNKNFVDCEKIIEKIKENFYDKSVSLSIFGSLAYGKKEGSNVKPDKYSDIDFNLVSEKIPFEEDSPFHIKIPREGVYLFEKGLVDILCIRTQINSRKILFQLMIYSTFNRLCKFENSPLFMYKEPKGSLKEVPHLYDYPRKGKKGLVLDFNKIFPLNEGNLISYENKPIINGNFALTTFQSQILTQKELIDKEGNLEGGRKNLTKKLRGHFSYEEITSFFKYESPYWSKEFEEIMKARLK